MESDPNTKSPPVWMVVTGWILTILPSLMLILSGVMKLQKPDFLVEGFTKLGWPDNLALTLGIVELSCVVIYLIPQTTVLGAILLTGYLGGATATHVRIGDDWFGPVLIGVVIWLGPFLRDARLRVLLPFCR